MKQQTFSDIEYSHRRKKTRREEFLETMDRIIPWQQWIDLIKEHYPSGKRGRRPRGIETMLRMYLIQKWFNMSAAAVEDAVCDSYAMRSFMHIDFLTEQVPDSSTLLRFRHLLEKYGIGEQILADARARLKNEGLILRSGTITDAAIVAAPGFGRQGNRKRDNAL